MFTFVFTSRCRCEQRGGKLLKRMEAPPGFEPGVEVLQTSALPLGDGALMSEWHP